MIILIILRLVVFVVFSFDEGPDDLDDEEPLDEPAENEVGYMYCFSFTSGIFLIFASFY